MNEHYKQFIALAEQSDLIRDEWQCAYGLWRETASAEILQRCTDLARDLHVVCAKMDTVIRQSMNVVPA